MFEKVHSNLINEIEKGGQFVNNKEKYLKVESSFNPKPSSSKKRNLKDVSKLYLDDETRQKIINRHKISYRILKQKIKMVAEDTKKKREEQKAEEDRFKEERLNKIKEMSKNRAQAMHQKLEKFKERRKQREINSVNYKKNFYVKKRLKIASRYERSFNGDRTREVTVGNSEGRSEGKKGSEDEGGVTPSKPDPILGKNYGIDFKAIKSWSRSHSKVRRSHQNKLKRSREQFENKWKSNWKLTPSCRRGFSYDKVISSSVMRDESRYRGQEKQRRVREYSDQIREKMTQSLQKIPNSSFLSTRPNVYKIDRRKGMDRSSAFQLGQEYIDFLRKFNEKRKNSRPKERPKEQEKETDKKDKQEEDKKEEEKNKDYLKILRKEGVVKDLNHKVIIKEALKRFGSQGIDYYELAGKLDMRTKRELEKIAVSKNKDGKDMKESAIIADNIKLKLKVLSYVYDKKQRENKKNRG